MFDQNVPNRPLFSILGIPVTVTFWHIAVLGMMLFDRFRVDFKLGLGMMLLVSLSVLAHEMGHALVSRHFGLEPYVILLGFGGVTYHQPAKKPRDDFLIVAAGPTVNFLLFFLFRYLAQPTDSLRDQLFAWGSVANLFWAVYNLLPIVPLDGGQITRIALRKWLKTPLTGDRWAFRIGLGLGGMLAVLFLVKGMMFAAVILGMAALQNYNALRSLEAQPLAKAEAVHPQVRQLIEQARQFYLQQRYDDAIRLSHQARAEAYVSNDEIRQIWHLLSLSSARVLAWEDALRYAERVPDSPDLAKIQAICLLNIADAGRARRFLAMPAALLLPTETIEQLQALARTNA